MQQTSTGSTRGVTGKSKKAPRTAVKRKRDPGNLKAFDFLAGSFILSIKRAGPINFKTPYLSKFRFRNCLRSSREARELYPVIPQKYWIRILDYMINEARKLKDEDGRFLSTERLKYWRDNR